MHAANSKTRFRDWHTWAALPPVFAVSAFAVSFVAPTASNPIPPLFEIASAERGRFPLAISPATIDLGMLHPGESAEAVLTLRNLGSRQITVARIEASCPCIQVKPDQLQIEAGAVRGIALKFVSDEPEFVGGLSVSATGHGAAIIACSKHELRFNSKGLASIVPILPSCMISDFSKRVLEAFGPSISLSRSLY